MNTRCVSGAGAVGAVALVGALLAAAPGARAGDVDDEPSIWLGNQVQLVPTLQYQPRVHLHSGRDFAPGRNFSVVEHRARVGVELRISDWASALVEVWDVRFWGEERDVIGDDSADGIDVRRAWVELRTRGGGAVRLRVGRQRPGFDNQRLIAPAIFAQAGRSFDGIRLDFRGKRARGSLFWLRIGEADAGTPVGASGPIPDRNFAGAWLQLASRFSLTLLYDNDQQADLRRFTTGFYYSDSHKNGLLYAFDAYYQTGERGKGAAHKRIHAFLFGGRLGYRFKVKSELTVIAAVDWLSGDKTPDDDTDRAFNTLFNAGHRHYGRMDYFLAQPRDNGGRGLVDAGIRATLRPLRRLFLHAQYHHFRFAAPWIEASGRRTRAVGNELDFIATFTLHRYISLRMAVGAFRPERGVTCVRGGCRDGAPTEYFSYLQLDFNIGRPWS